MKKKGLLILIFSVLAMCLFAVSAFADTVYKDESGKELFRYQVYDGTEENYQNYFSGVIKNYQGEFPKFDENGNALTWYVISSETVGEDTVKTVGSFLTVDPTGEHATLSDEGVYKYVNQAKELSIVSAYFPDNSNVVTLSLTGYGYGVKYTWDQADNDNLLFLRLPNTLTVLPERCAQATPIIDFSVSDDALYESISAVNFHDCRNLRSADINKNLKIIHSNGHTNNGHAFYNCVSLTDVYFAEGSQLETIEINAFYYCVSLKEITLPNSVVNLGARVFQHCISLETVRVGANVGKGLTEYNLQSLFWECYALKYVYFPATMIPTDGSHLFPSGANGMVFFYTGDYAQYETLLNRLTTLGNNGKFIGATPILWDSTKDDQYYKDMAATDNKNYVVYGYGKCEAFYGGHAWKGENNVIAGNYFESIGIGDSCANCEKTDVKETIAPIFVWKGYSASTFGEGYSVVQGFTVNTSSIEAYKVYAPDFDFGVLATVNKEVDEEGNAVGIKPSLDSENVLTGNFVKDKHEYLDIKLTGIPKGQENTKIVFCVYVTVNGTMYYLDNNITGESIVGISYNEVLELQKSEVTE